jgi:plasmid stabilization system protein ParE
MAARLTLHWTPIAIGHLRAAYEHLAQDSVPAADALIERIFSAGEQLAQYPQIGREGRVKGTREVVIAGTPYVVAYRVRRSRIDVLAVFHGARKWPEEF